MIRQALLITAVTLASLAVIQPAAHAQPPAFGVATTVWGQPTLASRVCAHAGPSTLCGPAQVAVDTQGNLWVVDFNRNRVLMFPPGSTRATKVFGQYGSFITHGCSQRPPAGSAYPPAPSRYTLCQPFGVAVDAAGTLYIADSIDNRVLVYYHAARKPAAAPADLVLGQPGFSDTYSNDVPAGGKGPLRCRAPQPASACTLNSPMELSLDAAGDLLVPDVDNNRVLLWSRGILARARRAACLPHCFIPASRVWGQYGSFSANLANNPAIPPTASSRCTAITFFTPASACTLSGPSAAVADPAGDLFIADTANNRVLELDGALSGGRQDASSSYGQSGELNTIRADAGGVSAVSLWHPLALAFSPDAHLWVSDFRNMRVLEYPVPGSAGAATAVRVLGQRGDMAATGCAALADTLCGPTGIAFDAAGNAYVADGLNNRVLEYPLGG